MSSLVLMGSGHRYDDLGDGNDDDDSHDRDYHVLYFFFFLSLSIFAVVCTVNTVPMNNAIV